MRQLSLLFVTLAMAMSLVGSASPVKGARSARADDLVVLSGYGRSGPQFVVEEFFPKFLRVAQGTTVTWVQDSPRGHTVTFLAGEPLPPENIPLPEDPSGVMRNPKAEYPTWPDVPWDGSSFINSGRMQEGERFSITFAQAGTYEFVCFPHLVRDDMKVTVEVVEPGTEDITTQEDVDGEIAAEWALFQRQVAAILAGRDGLASVPGADGKNTSFVRVGTDQRSEANFQRGRLTVRAFLPDRLTIRAGDTVVWYTDTRVPVHTVTFMPRGAVFQRWVPRLEDGSLVPLEGLDPRGRYVGNPDSLDWPRVVEDPTFLVVTRPSPTYDPTRLFNSGELGDNDPTVGRAWSLTFSTPGTFDYFCIPHIELGMFGRITVEPA